MADQRCSYSFIAQFELLDEDDVIDGDVRSAFFIEGLTKQLTQPFVDPKPWIENTFLQKVRRGEYAIKLLLDGFVGDFFGQFAAAWLIELIGKMQRPVRPRRPEARPSNRFKAANSAVSGSSVSSTLFSRIVFKKSN